MKRKLEIRIIPIDYILFALVYVIYASGVITKIIDVPHFRTIYTLIACIIAIVVLPHHLSGGIEKHIIVTFVFYLFPVITSAILYTGDFKEAFVRLVGSMSIVLYTNYLIDKYDEESIVIFFVLFEILLYVNLISMVLYPNGMYRTVNTGTGERLIRVTRDFVRTDSSRVHWLLGHQTLLSRYVLQAVCIVFLSKGRGLKYRSVALLIVCAIELIVANSASNYLMLILLGSLYMVYSKFEFIKSKLIYIIFGLVYFVYSAIVFSPFIDKILMYLSLIMKRTVELTTRLRIWQRSIDAIKEKPFIGYGVIDETSSRIWSVLGVANPHSQYFYVLYEVGIVGVILLAVFILFAGKRCAELIEYKEARIMLAFISTILVGMITDDYLLRSPFILIMFTICFRTDVFINTDEETIDGIDTTDYKAVIMR